VEAAHLHQEPSDADVEKLVDLALGVPEQVVLQSDGVVRRQQAQ
jgi:hypothetical protein